MRTSVIIPAINEGESLGQVLVAIDRSQVDEIILVDGGSTDNTVAVAEASSAKVILEPRPGYGRACATGVANAAGDILVFMDADGADDPHQILNLIGPILSGEVDLVLGSRIAGNIATGAMPWHQRFGNWLSAKIIQVLYGLPITDLSPFRAVLYSKLLELDMIEMSYGWPTEMITKAARNGWKIVEIPVNYYPRLAGKSKISGTLKGTILATYFILSTIIKYARKENSVG